MKMNIEGKMLVILCSLLVAGCTIVTCDSSYDYSASVECLEEPLPPQYGGGLVANPNFDSGLDEWNIFGSGKIASKQSKSGNNYMVAYDRSLESDSFSFFFYLQKDLLYTFSAWLQLDRGSEVVSAFLQIPNGQSIIIGSVVAKSGCWSMLKGGFTIPENMRAQIFLSSKNTGTEIWIDNVSLKPFTKTEWQEQQNKSIDRVRKRKIRIHVNRRDGQKLQGAKIIINQTRPQFLLGCSSTEFIISNTAYQDWFTSRFPVTTFNNEMKWYYTEVLPGQENYTVPDAMVSFFKKHRISIRGHTILWDSANLTQYWVKLLPPREIFYAAMRRMGSVVSRYLGDVIAWDVMNENIHNTFYEDIIGPNASAMFYQIARAMDLKTPLFLNEYNTLEFPLDKTVIPSRYAEKIRETKAFPGNEDMVIRIGLQGHFLRKPNISHMRATLDVLGATNMPIWLTELDTKRGPTQAAQLEDVIREAFSHPAVEGIIVWGGWKPTACSERCLTDKNYDVLPRGCAEMCLTDDNFKNLPAGDVVDKLLKEWKTTNLTGITNEDGVFEQKVFLGEYTFKCSHPQIPARTLERTFNVTNGKGPLEIWVAL
ncbi:Endo-1,4-beta-xylanase [Handroanthus impetiginosus]|uniref:Endo-1,4-beta-xylanase n=1 Tax=Handroanthus impetiginosus TaxID=429701 RepID=A0A2G9GY56_9LAMI|nr:Endo-1,4-beta-xylanase [Handroanthus impetiginosus]